MAVFEAMFAKLGRAPAWLTVSPDSLYSVPNKGFAEGGVNCRVRGPSSCY